MADARERTLVVINGYIVDATLYALVHPGGDKVILACAGREATAEFNTHSSDTMRRVCAACLAYDEAERKISADKAVKKLNPSIECHLSDSKGGGCVYIVGKMHGLRASATFGSEAVAAFRAILCFCSLATWTCGCNSMLPALGAAVFIGSFFIAV